MKCISIFKCNPQIEVIDKSHCSLEDVPNFQNYSRSLEELFLDANKLTNLNENVFRLTKLRRFSFSDNVISDIPPDIAKLVNLVELDCSRNKIQAIPEQIKFLRGLQVCDFSANEIEYLPSGLVQLKNLTCLTLNYCLIKNLPEDFGLLKNLESLELRENELETLPASITSLESLKKLDVGRNRIFRLPDDIGRLTNLEYLLVDGNCLETIPSKIGKLENLQCLDLGQQYPEQLKSLPDEISGLTSLTDLHLSDNHIEKLPDGIRYLKNLTIFKVDNNFLTELNPNIGGCVSLQELVLTSNQIDDIPSSIGALTELRSLNADSNVIEELPPQIGNLKQLGILSLRDNLLTHLPDEIGQLEMATVIDISGNYLEYLPISMTALNLKALWLSKNQAQPLPKLQIDELPDSGTKVLTCYLLPQYNEKEDELEQSGANNNNNNQNEYRVDDENARPAAVSFDTAALDDAELSSDVNFVRHDTPHPRELKARHQKLFNNTNKPEMKGHDNASFSLADQLKECEQNFNAPVSYQPQEQHNVPIRIEPSLEYESNGLPEVPISLGRPSLPSQPPPISSGSLHKQSRNTNYPQEPENHHKQMESENYPYSLKNNGREEYPKDRQYDNSIHDVDEATTEPSGQVMDILVRRSKNHTPGLGLSIAGGKDTPPYKDNDEGIFVSKVTPGGPAEAAGVRVGDKILAVNSNIFYEGITHHKAVSIFKKVKPDYMEFTMRVYRDPEEETSCDEAAEQSGEPEGFSGRLENLSTNSSKITERNTSTFTRTYTIPVATESNGTGSSNLRQFLSKEQPGRTKSNASTLPPGMGLTDNTANSINKNIIYTTLVKDYKHDLGLVLENRSDNESKSSWSNVVIADILPNSIASRDGKLQVDDRLISINGADVTGIDVDRIMLMLEGTERFVRIVVARGDADDPIGAALRNMPVRPPLGSWFSSTSNMSHRPSLIESYQRPTFGSVTSLQKQPQLLGTKPPKPPKPSHLLPKDSEEQSENGDNPIARPRGGIRSAGASFNGQPPTQIDDPERRAWRRERMKSIDDDVEMVKMITEAQRRRREEKE